jgi:putative tryptophan/tyrosine transport system substrate-binding protein
MTLHHASVRAVVFGAIVLLAALGAANAQQAPKMARLGVLLFSGPDSDPNFKALLDGLTDLGWVQGKNLTITSRGAQGKPERLPELAAELVALKPDVIMALGGDVAPSVRTATTTIPVVMAVSVDPVRAGLVPSLARPGGNITGVTFVSSELAPKRLQYLKDAMPRLTRVAVIWNPNHIDPEYADTQTAGRALGVQVQSLEVRTLSDLDGAFQAADAGRAEAIIVISSRLTTFAQSRIMELAGKHRLPVVSGWGPWAQSGALLSYGPDLNVVVRRSASQVDRILKGASPGSLAVEQPTKFDLVVNLKTAAAFGLAIPPSLRLQASQLIE